MPRLIITKDSETYNLDVGAVFRIGRHPDNDLTLRGSQVSRWHAEIRREKDHYRLRDLDSLNGTSVNGQRVQDRLLKNGDIIKVGSHQANWLDEEDPDDDLTKSPFTDADIVKLVQELNFDEPYVPAKPNSPSLSYVSAPEHLRLLLQIARILNLAPSLDDFLQQTLEMVMDSLGADRGAILVKEGEVIINRKQHSRKGKLDGDIPISKSIINKVMDKGMGVLTVDARADPRFDQGVSIRVLDIRSAICVPLWEGEQARGVFYLDNLAVDRPFNEEDLDLTSAVAHHLALGIRHYKILDIANREAILRHQLQRYHSPDVVDLLLHQSKEAQKFELTPQEREVTIMFCDIVEFCSISARLSPAETTSLLNSFYDEVTTAIFRHSGSVNKFIGDAIMALWGAPFSHGNDAQQAVRCAANILKSLYKSLWRVDADKWFKLRIGINTGGVFAGHIGSESMLEYTVIGTPVNIASRIQTMAKPNQIFIGEETFKQLGPEFPTKDLGDINIKGIDLPIRVYELLWKEFKLGEDNN